MLLLVYMPHNGREETDYIEVLESVRVTPGERRKMGILDFFFGSDLNIELKLASLTTSIKVWILLIGVGCMDLSAKEPPSHCRLREKMIVVSIM